MEISGYLRFKKYSILVKGTFYVDWFQICEASRDLRQSAIYSYPWIQRLPKIKVLHEFVQDQEAD